MERPEKVNAVAVTESLFHTLGVRPLLGRTFSPDEERYHGPHAVILSEAYWQSRFGRDPRILDRALQLNGDLYPVIGVMPGTFQFPNDVTEMWVPIAFQPQALVPAARTTRYLHMYARLAPGVGFERASTGIDQLSHRMSEQNPAAYPLDRMGWRFFLTPMARDDDGSLRNWLAILFAAVTCLLTIVGSNVAGLFLVRSTERQFDLSVRMALGASRFRVARQVLAEVLIIAVAAGAAGLCIAKTGVCLLVKFGPKYLPSGEPRLEAPVYWFGLGLALLTGLACGLYPAWSATRFPTLGALKDGGQQRTTSAGKRRMQNGLIVAQVAVATTLLICGGLLIRSLLRLLDARPGFDPQNVLSMQISLPGARYRTPESRAGFYDSVLDQIRHLPGVDAASACTLLPFGWGENMNTFEIVGKPKPPVDPLADFNNIAPDFFETMKIPLLRGRPFLPTDRRGSELVAVIDELMAERYFGGDDPIGREVRMPWATYRVVGVAGTVKAARLDETGQPTLYFSATQAPGTDMSLVIRSRLRQTGVVDSVQQIVSRLDKDQPIYDVLPLEARIDRSLRTRRFVVSLILTFAASGALLASLGLYGLLSYTIALRRREIGIRIALGADSGAIAWLVYRGGLALMTTGLAFGCGGALLARRFIAGQFYGTHFSDGLTWLTVLGIVILTCLLACALPARRAASLDPMESLRAE